MSNWFGGIYRHPPPPQRSKPSAVLPVEVFPNPPLGNRGRGIVMAIVAAQWIAPPLPQQSRPVVTEAAPVVEFIPASQVQNRLIIDGWWRPVPQLSQRYAVFTSGLFVPFTRDQVVDGLWRIERAPLQHLPTVTEGEAVVEVFVPYVRDQIAIRSWDRVLNPRQLLPIATEGVPVVEVLIPFTRDQIAIRLWDRVLRPQQRFASAILPSEVFPDPPTGQQRQQIINALVAAQWIWVPQPEQRRPVVTEEGVPVVEVFVPFTRDRVAGGLWIPVPVSFLILQQRTGVAFIAPPIIQTTGGFLGREFMS